MFGKASDGLLRLISFGLSTYEVAAQASKDLSVIESAAGGLHVGPLRATAASSVVELLQTACLMYSSLSGMDKFDEDDESDTPQPEEVNRRFGTEVRSEIAMVRPDLVPYFGRAGRLIDGGQAVKFGFFSPRAIVHFTVLSAVRQGASVKDARARLWELQRAKTISGVQHAALIAAVPHDDDATLGAKTKEQLAANKLEIENEADAVSMRWYAVHNAPEGAKHVLELAG